MEWLSKLNETCHNVLFPNKPKYFNPLDSEVMWTKGSGRTPILRHPHIAPTRVREQSFPITQYFDLSPPSIWTEFPYHTVFRFITTFDMNRVSLSHSISIYHHLRFEQFPYHTVFRFITTFDMNRLSLSHSISIYHHLRYEQFPYHTVFRFITTFDMNRVSLSHSISIYHHLRYEQTFPITQYFY